MTTEILVFVPGTLGSELWDGDDRIWPGSIADGVFRFSDAKFERLLKKDLEPRDIVRSAAGGLLGVYKAWIRAFEGIARREGPIFCEKPDGGRKTLRVFPYDWRLDLEVTASALAGFLDQIVAGTPDADIKLVCHSMGGLLGRYYLESGHFDASPAHSKISLFVTLGTPHNGAPIAYAGVAGLHKTSFLSQEQTRALANDAQYPSLYQLIPAPTQSFIWDADEEARYSARAADDPAIAVRLALSSAGLAAWKRFRAGLTGNRPAHVRYFYIVGSRQETLVRLLWDGRSLQAVELEDAGDGTVPLAGAIDPVTQFELVGKSHVSLIETHPARHTLARLFGARTLFTGPGLAPTISLDVRDSVVTTEDEIHVQIEFTPQIGRFSGELRFQRADLAEGGPPDGAFADLLHRRSHAIELTGVGLTHVNLKTAPLGNRGIYRPVLTPRDATGEIVGPAIVVQET